MHVTRPLYKRAVFIPLIGAVALMFAACDKTPVGTTTGPIGFETDDTPAYAAGTIDEQNGWQSNGAAGSGCATYDHEVDGMAASGTEPNSFGFGSQSLRMSSAVTSGCFDDQTFSVPTVDQSGETTAPDDGQHSGGARHGFFEATWSFATAGNPLAAQEGQHVVASPDRGDGARMSWVEMQDCSATVPVDIDECQQGNAGLEVNFFEYDADVADFVFHNVATGLNRNNPHSIRLRMFFFEGADNDVVEVCVDGTTCVTGGSWEDYFRDEESNPTRSVDSLLFRTAGTATPASAGNGFFIDDVTLRSFTHTGASFSASKPGPLIEGNGGSQNATYTVTLNQALPFTTTVDYSTANDTATAPSDYTTTSGTLTFLPGETTKTVDVPVHGDNSDESHETFKFNLSNAKSVGESPGAASNDEFVYVKTDSVNTQISDDDSTVRVSDATVAEGNAGLADLPFVVTLDNPSAVSVSVNLSTANGSAVAPGDFTALSTTVTFAPNQTSKTVNVKVKGDVIVESNENLLANLSSPTNTAIGDGVGAGVITNDD